MIGLQLLLQIEGMTYQEIGSELGMSRQMVQKWINKEKPIAENRLKQLSNYFNVPTKLITEEITNDTKARIKKILIEETK